MALAVLPSLQKTQLLELCLNSAAIIGLYASDSKVMITKEKDIYLDP